MIRRSGCLGSDGPANARPVGFAVLLLTGLASSFASAQALSPQEVFRQVSPSVVVIEVKEFPEGKPPRLVATGSGVVIPSRDKDENLVATNCHLTDESPLGIFSVRQGENKGFGILHGRDPEKDLCLLEATFPENEAGRGSTSYKKLPAVRIASSQWLEVGDPVYAIGAPQGLELTLSNGLVSGIREYRGTEYIQTTAPISNGSSGGGLFDAQGRLVGITTMYLKDSQSLNFAVPAELLASVPMVKEPAAATDDAASASAAAAAAAASAAQAAADAAAAAADAAATQARSRWLEAYKDDEETISFDLQTIDRSGSDVTVWMRLVYLKPKKLDSGKFLAEDLTRETFYCGTRTMSYDQFSWRDPAGDVILTKQLKSWEIERKTALPETVGEHLYEFACN